MFSERGGPWLVALAIAAMPLSNSAAADFFTKKNSKALVEMAANQQQAVAVAVLAAPGQNELAAKKIMEAGGRVRYRADDVDFLSVVLPASAAYALLSQPFIESFGVDVHDALFRFRGLLPDADKPFDNYEGENRQDWPGKTSAYPVDHPYDVLKALDADELRRKHPTYDGRGVVIAQVEAFSDLLLPHLQWSLNATGERVPKFIDLINHPDVEPSLAPEAKRTDWQWVKLGTPKKAPRAQIKDGGTTYRLPAAGVYRVGTLQIPAHITAPINLPRGKKKAAATNDSLFADYMSKSTQSFQVLWSDERRALWLDGDQDQDFSDEKPVRLYVETHDVGVFGEDDPATERRESRAYVVQKDGDHVSVNMDCNLHATMVAGVAAATRGPDGHGEGVAPAAQVLAINHGMTLSSFGWSLIRAFADPRTDVVLVEATFPPQQEDELNDGSSVLGVLMSRLHQRYRKPSFWTANNIPAMDSIVDPAIAAETIAVGAYDTAESLHVAYGMKLPSRDTVHSVGSEGPGGNGIAKPDLLAPSMMIGVRDGYLSDDGLNTLPGLWRLPATYMLTAGTSAATPITVGAASVLISAAKQQRLAHDDVFIKRSLTSTARYLANAGTHQQGAGVLRVGAAWEYMQKHGESTPLVIDVSAPVRTGNSHLLKSPHRGVGLFEREGWRAGQKAARAVTLIRRNGLQTEQPFTLRWQGNSQGTFAVEQEVRLPLNSPIELPVTILPKNEGVHSATLQLVDPSSRESVLNIPMTVVVPHELDAAHGYAQQLDLEVQPLGRKAVFIRVPENSDALTVEVSHTSRDTGMLMHDPSGRPQGFGLDFNPVTGTARETIAKPMPGVWGLFFMDGTGRREFFRTRADFAGQQAADAPPAAKVRLRASVAGVALRTPSPLTVDAISEITAQNTMAELTGGRVTGELGQLHIDSGSLLRGERRIYEIQVPAGSPWLMADVRATGDKHLDADLYLFDCTGKTCRLARAGRGYASDERVFVDNPRPGTWRVILDATAASEPVMSYEYRDLFTLPEAGLISTMDAAQARSSGAAWSVKFRPWIMRSAQPDRLASAVLYVQDDQRSSQLQPETLEERYGCPTTPLCGFEHREKVPLGLTIIPLQSAPTVQAGGAGRGP